ncbi:hypothetical protein, partial [Hydrogenophaga laconesensis]
MSAPSVHDDWLSLIEISGPFLAVPVLKEAFPQGLEELGRVNTNGDHGDCVGKSPAWRSHPHNSPPLS